MDEEVTTITSSSPLPKSSPTNSPEVKSSTPEEKKDEVQEETKPQENNVSTSESESAEESSSESESEHENEEQEDEDNEEEQEEAKEEEQEEDDDDNELEGALESEVKEEQLCRLCGEKYKQPRVLMCLHVFCTPCLEKLVAEREEKKEEPIFTQSPDDITCPVCKQKTPLGDKGVEDLPLDTVMTNLLDLAAMNDPQIVCTSCKTKEKAVARCSDCASFLCSNCVTAHHYMRCFDNHKVVTFEELKNGEGVDLLNPMFCTIHHTENLKYYCNSCQTLICNECIVVEHKQPLHVYERIADLEENQKAEVKALITECKGKVAFCEDATTSLENALSEVQMQRDNARGQIEETFQTYRTMLEARKEEMLKELDEMHSKQELQVMDMFHDVEKTIEKIEDGTKFAERVVEHASGAELLSMKKMITMQLMSLINNTPKPDVNIKLDFITDQTKFEEAMKETFGSFAKPDQDAKNTSDTSIPSLDAFAMGRGRLTTDGPLPMPTVSTASFMPDVTQLPVGSGLLGMPTDPTSNSIASSIQANLPPERSSSRNSSYSPAMSDSGISVDAGSTGSNSGLINLTALAKLGTISVNAQGQITLNGQVVPGLTVNNTTGLPQATASPNSRGATPTPTSQADNTLTSLLNSIGGTSSPAPPVTPQLPDMSGLLSNAASSMGGGRLSRDASGSASSLLAPVGQYVPPRPDSSDPMLSDHLDTTGEGGRGLTEFASLLTQTSAELMNGLSRSNSTSPAQNLGIPIHGAMSTLAMPVPVPLPTPSFSPNTMNVPFPSRSSSGKMSAMQIRCKFGQLGPGKGQFNSPHGFCLGIDEDIVVADTNNHRVQIFEKTGEFKYQFGIPGREEGQLWYPRKVAVMRSSGKYVVCDRGNERSRMQIFTKSGHFIKKIAIRYIDIVAGLAITSQGHIVAVDSVSPTVFCIADTGDLLKWFDCSDYMREPSDIAVNGKEYFVCDFKGHCVVVFSEEGQFLRRIGCENITNFPNGIDISDAGDVLVGDSHGNRFHVAVFQRDGSLIGEFECPYVKVSRCCGLKITSEGYVVTLAKNNHHVLVLNTLYIT